MQRKYLHYTSQADSKNTKEIIALRCKDVVEAAKTTNVTNHYPAVYIQLSSATQWDKCQMISDRHTGRTIVKRRKHNAFFVINTAFLLSCGCMSTLRYAITLTKFPPGFPPGYWGFYGGFYVNQYYLSCKVFIRELIKITHGDFGKGGGKEFLETFLVYNRGVQCRTEVPWAHQRILF